MDSINKGFGELMVILSAVVGLAIVAVIFSKKADTANVLDKGGTAFANIIKAAVSPIG